MFIYLYVINSYSSYDCASSSSFIFTHSGISQAPKIESSVCMCVFGDLKHDLALRASEHISVCKVLILLACFLTCP